MNIRITTASIRIRAGIRKGALTGGESASVIFIMYSLLPVRRVLGILRRIDRRAVRFGKVRKIGRSLRPPVGIACAEKVYDSVFV